MEVAHDGEPVLPVAISTILIHRCLALTDQYVCALCYANRTSNKQLDKDQL